MKVGLSELEALTTDVVASYGYPPEEAGHLRRPDLRAAAR